MKVRESNLLMHSVPDDMDALCMRKGSDSLTTRNKHDRYAIALSTSHLTQVLGEVFLIMRHSSNLALLFG